MGKDTIVDLLTSIRNTDMNKKGTIRVVSTNITENIVKILLREGFIESVRKHQERIPKVLAGMGIAILSTSRGIMTDREARLNKIGGEVLCYIW
ncbi:hypothetical protein DAI22_05g156400 [Oryza sativa Japonica Group]|nr:hypothetical protein DAI22_05g156400 [Oryza sativa Japonica Group]